MTQHAQHGLQALIGLPDGPTVSYLRVHYFCSEGTRAFIDAVNMSEFWGVDGYIIDLRNNPGQLLLIFATTRIRLLRPAQQPRSVIVDVCNNPYQTFKACARTQVSHC